MYNRKGPNVIIIDDAHLTYWDTSFWNSFLKAIDPYSRNRVILFASYGSPSGYTSAQDTDMIVPDRYRVSFRPIDHKDGIAPAGLLLTTDEFADMVGKSFPEGCFEEDFLDYVFRVTSGHTGAVADLLGIVSAHDVSLRIKLQHSLMTASSHTVNSRMTTGSTRWKSFRANFLSTTSGRVSSMALYSEVGSPCLVYSSSRTLLEFSVQCLATTM